MIDPQGQGKCQKQTKSGARRVLPLFLFVLLAACLPAIGGPTEAPTLPPPSSSPTDSPTLTPTIVWFPPTSTPTAPADRPPTATPFPAPPRGEILFTDEFIDGSLWTLSQGTRGGAALGIGELTIVLNEPRMYIAATRTDVYLTDFYLEATAASSLCSGMDEYGLVLRAASPSDFYRFSLSCDGQLRVDLIRGGTASSPLPWMVSAAVPRNAPGNVRIGVWADGDTTHLFLNDAYQATVNTSQLPGGTIGFFARSAGQNAVTINFSDLIVWALEPGG